MKMKTLLILQLLGWACNTLYGTAQVSVPHTTGTTGTTVTVPISISNFSNVGAITLKLQYSSSVLTFLELTNWHASLTSAVVNNSGGVLTIAWENTIPATISSGKMADIRFTFNGDSTSLSFNESTCEIADTAGNILSANFTSGSVSTLRPPAPSLEQPANLASSQAVDITFLWRAASSAVSYGFQVATDSLFSSLFYADTTIADTFKTLNTLLHNQTYYWRVRGKTAADWGSWSGSYSFSTMQGINLSLTLYFQGFYDTGILEMIRSDTATIELHQGSSPWTAVDYDTCVVSAQGQCTARFSAPASGYYYIAVRHRNSIESWSADSIQMLKGQTTSYNFTVAASRFYGSNAVLVGTKYCVYSADVNQDGIVDFSDLTQVDNDQFNFMGGYIATDVTGDDFVDFSDLTITDNNSYNFISVIKPGMKKHSTWR